MSEEYAIFGRVGASCLRLQEFEPSFFDRYRNCLSRCCLPLEILIVVNCLYLFFNLQFKGNSSYYAGEPFLCVHFRRRDYKNSRVEHIPSVEHASSQIIDKLSNLNLDTVFIATDTDETGESLQLRLDVVISNGAHSCYLYRISKVKRSYSSFQNCSICSISERFTISQRRRSRYN